METLNKNSVKQSQLYIFLKVLNLNLYLTPKVLPFYQIHLFIFLKSLSSISLLVQLYSLWWGWNIENPDNPNENIVRKYHFISILAYLQIYENLTWVESVSNYAKVIFISAERFPFWLKLIFVKCFIQTFP